MKTPVFQITAPPAGGVRLLPGMTIAIEPMVTQGSCEVKILKDGWTTVTKDGKLARPL